jgi:hypothetical protein
MPFEIDFFTYKLTLPPPLPLNLREGVWGWVYSFVVLCDPLWFNDLKLNHKGSSKVITKATKDL